MKKTLLIAFLLVTCSLAKGPIIKNGAPTPEDYVSKHAPNVTINLGLRPNHRFYDIVKERPHICSTLKTFVQSYYQQIERKLKRINTGPIQDLDSLKVHAQAWYDNLMDPTIS
jgi:hypothetical protein